ncbi:hypothetical protein K438DRAFT_1769237 [Mycena galopus ATCC 62051]|nr:hypothetical protein K438DRAFT_1769237 [Mycena galopus ATCC 62051]
MGASTREMGPGSRQDTLDDFWHYWNWIKWWEWPPANSRGKLQLEDFTAAQRQEVPAWQKAVDNFETGASLVNPYELPQSGPTLREIKLQLMLEEQERERNAAAARDHMEETMTEYLMLGLEIEGQQRQLGADLLANKAPTTKELTDFVTRRTRISRQIKKLRAPATTGEPDALEAECTPLFLPSALLPSECLPPLSVPELAAAEARLRDGQCTTGKGGSALAGGRGGREEKEAEGDEGKRKEAAHVNENGEVQGVPGLGENTRLISWIWQAGGKMSGVIGKEIHEGVKVEWCKAYAGQNGGISVRCCLIIAARFLIPGPIYKAPRRTLRGRLPCGGGWRRDSAAYGGGSQTGSKRHICWAPLTRQVGMKGQWEDEEGVATAAAQAAGEAEEEECVNDMELDDGDGGELASQRAHMDELLAVQTASLHEYNEL